MRRNFLIADPEEDLDLESHRSIRLRVWVNETAKYPGGINIFGRGFGNDDQDIVLRMTMRPWA